MQKQTGRSMIEMLGVLAIIGVLSIGGLTLYRRAIDTHKANSIFDDVNRFEVVISERIDQVGANQISRGDFVPTSGYEMAAFNEPENESHNIRVYNVSRGVCRIVLEKGEEKYTMYANTRLYEGDSSICRDVNEMRFYFGNVEGLCSVADAALGEENCSDGCLCPNPKENECKLDQGNTRYPSPRPTNYQPFTTCCPKGEDIVNCSGNCVNGTCTGENMFFNPKECTCTCTDPDNMIYDAEHNKCTCGTDSNGAPLKLKDGSCVCQGVGYTLVDGKCTRVECSGGTTGNTFQCYINGLRCGYNCDSAGNNCVVGICHAENCSEGETFVQKQRPDNTMYRYACQHNVRDDYICYRWWGAVYYCYKDGEYCCQTNDTTTFKCTSGLCGDESRCTALNPNAKLIGNYCSFPDKLTCAYNDGLWDCYKYGYYCANCEDEEIKNGTCCTGNSCKAYTMSGTYNPETKRCEYTVGEGANQETISCTTTDITESESKQTCYAGNVERCVIYSYNTRTRNYAYGRCSATEANCPEGTEYGIVGSYYDCKNKTLDAPVCSYADNKITCYYNDVYCGRVCDYFGQNCGQVYLPQCAAPGKCPQTGYDMGLTENQQCTCDGAVTSNVSVTVDDGNGGTTTEKHSFCCPANHTYVNGGCTLL